jgi:crotonobetaine/carnitine-CoA ligase
VGVPSEFAGGEDEIKVCLVLKAGTAFEPAEFLAWCEEKLPHFAVPRYVEIRSELPRTPSNKIQKYLLRQAGVSGEVWDRVKTGYQLRAELDKAGRRGTSPAPGRSTS